MQAPMMQQSGTAIQSGGSVMCFMGIGWLAGGSNLGGWWLGDLDYAVAVYSYFAK